jgi:Zn-dependent protease with chaperone function
MFALRGLGVSLSVFVLLYCGISLLVIALQSLVIRLSRGFGPALASDCLFAWRILPLVVSLSVTAFYLVPSFLLLEPHQTNETFGADLMLLGLCCLALIVAGLLRAARAQRKTSQALAAWLHGAEEMGVTEAVPVFRTGKDAPALTVAGVCAPRVLVSETALRMLSSPELQTALRHEMAHVRRRDNLKKLLFRFSVFPGMSELESAWSEAAEMAADDAAVSSLQDALDLAAALIKLSRFSAGQHSPALASALLHNSASSLAARVRRLFAWSNSGANRRKTSNYLLPVMLLSACCVVLTYSSVLTGMHTVTEWLVR